MKVFPKLSSVGILNYRPFDVFNADIGALNVIIGANGSGKSSFFEILRFVRDGIRQSVPNEIIPGSANREIFHVQGSVQFDWHFTIESISEDQLSYHGRLFGPVGNPKIIEEKVKSTHADGSETYYLNFDVTSGDVYVDHENRIEHSRKKVNEFGLSTINSPKYETLYNLREYIRDWRFYDLSNVAIEKMRRPVLVEEEPVLQEDAGNLSSVLHYLMTEHGSVFGDIQSYLRLIVPGFDRLGVLARGGKGEVIVRWNESCVENDLTLADLSDGILRLLCCLVLCMHPKPPTLVCIDEPELGVHPRTLPVIAGLLKKASERTQLVITTHSSYFLTQFDISEIAIMRKENGAAKYIKPSESDAIEGILGDFGAEEIEALHRSDELEQLS